MKNISGFRCDKERKHHITKMLHNLLPWGHLLQQRNYQSYRHLKYLLCEEDTIEDWRHVRECDGLKPHWELIHQQLTFLEELLQVQVSSSKKDVVSLVPALVKYIVKIVSLVLV